MLCVWISILPETVIGQGFAVIISEIMGDPTPSVGLPEEEFIELVNVGDFEQDLGRWMISNRRTRSFLPVGLSLQPGEHLILCATRAVPEFEGFGKTVGLSPFPAITNTGDTIYLRDAGGQLVDAVRYHPLLLGSDKADGGWSIELVDYSAACRKSGNWKASSAAAGGTPGKQNIAVEAAFVPFNALFAAAVTDTTVLLRFSDGLDPGSVSADHFSLDGGVRVVDTRVLEPFSDWVELLVAGALDADRVYRIIVNGVQSCLGEQLREVELRVAIAGSGAGGLVINELLANPPPGGADYVELFHSGSYAVDLSRVQIANRNRQGAVTGARQISEQTRYLYPGEYLALTTNENWLRQHYVLGVERPILEMYTMPAYANEQGIVVLLWDGNTVVDEFPYHSGMHHAMVRSIAGVALERVNPLLSATEPDNWRSGAAHTGYGTPGYRNAQHQADADKNAFFLESPYFAPDGRPGIPMQCVIGFSFDQPGYLSSISVFDKSGRLVKVVVNNGLCAQIGAYTWNGTNERGNRMPAGLYIIVADCWHLSGKTRRFRLAVTLIPPT